MDQATINLSRVVPMLQDAQHAAGWLSEATLYRIAKELELPVYHVYGVASFYPHFRLQPPPKTTIHVCRDMLCHMKHGGKLADRLIAQRDKAGIPASDVEIESCSCLGQCDRAPAAMIDEKPVATGDLKDLLARVGSAMRGEAAAPLPPSPKTPATQADPYATPGERYGVLKKLVGELSKAESPEALLKAQQAVPKILIDAGLMGMGGGGFPVGRKWMGLQSPKAQAAEARFIVCNADESEVGTFKDREIMRNLPHLVLEGMAIAAVLTNARKGYFYIRHEYVDQTDAVARAIEEAKALGALGDSVFGSKWAVDIELFVSPGGYIQGEASALLECIEGKRGQPRNGTEDGGYRSTDRGLFALPTIVNNVESFLHVPAILHHGPAWFRALGRGTAPGLKWIGVGGDVTNPQVLEMHHGDTFRNALARCGGMADGKKLKAIMPSGPSFGFLPPEYIDAPMEFPDKANPGMLMKAGASIGSAAIVFLSEDRDLVDLALNCTEFYRNESCGKCVPCRSGSQKMVDIINLVMRQEARDDDIAQVKRLSDTLYLTSICGLGQVVPKPFESVVKYWGDDPRIMAARRRETVALTVNGGEA